MRFKIIYLAIILSFPGCEKKDNNEIVDYREKYCGDFYFTVEYSFSSTGSHQYEDNKFFFEGNISKKKYFDDVIIVKYSERYDDCETDSIYGEYIEARVNTSGEFQFTRFEECSMKSGFSGNFQGLDSIYFGWANSGLGFSEGTSVRGKRIYN
jgi:hypothetical protein